MFFSRIAVFATISVVFFGNAQQTIDPTTVPLNTRTLWCNDQKSSCPLLCPQVGGSSDPKSNNCDPNTLVYSCICSNNQSPNISQYSETIPYFECTEANNQCVDDCAAGDNACATSCRTTHPCGAQSPKRVNITSSTRSGAATAAATSSSSSTDYGFGGPATTTSASAGVSMGVGKFWKGEGEMLGLAVMLGGLGVGFAVLL